VFALAEARALEAISRPQGAAAEGAAAEGAPGAPADESERIKAWAEKGGKSVMNAKAAGDDLELAILGVIGGWWDGINARMVRSVLNDHKDAKSIRVLIDSPGGDYFDGVAIMNLLRRHKAHVTVEVIGEATSAGSVIAMGGDKIEMHVGTMMMIHRAWTFAMGNGDELRTTGEMLDKVDGGLLAVYKARTGAAEKDIKKWVDATTWMTSAEAVERGFADAELAALPPKSDPNDTEPAEDLQPPSESQARASAPPLTQLPRAAASRMPSVANQSAAPAAAEPTSGGTAAGEIPPAPEGSDPQTPTPPEEEPKAMSEKNEPNTVTPAVIRAMGLMAGATETDVMARVTALRELEVQGLAITGAKDSSELVGAIRGIKAKADNADKVSAELTEVKGERDKQNFEALIMKGTSAPVKLSGATAKLYQDRFDAAVKADSDMKDGAGRSEAVVKDLTGFLAVAPTIIASAARQPEAQKNGSGVGTGAASLTYNGRSYAEMKPADRARLSKDEPELHEAMRDDWIAAGRPAAPAKSA
jgi:ATP-dependent protease ClpP protease subunit